MDPNYHCYNRFPLLVKWLDCGAQSSLQVHPPAMAAAVLDGEPKTELWYILDAMDRVVVNIGFRPEVSEEDLRKGLEKGNVESLVHWGGLERGDAVGQGAILSAELKSVREDEKFRD